MKAALMWLLLAGLMFVSAGPDKDAAAPDVSVISFDWKYAGYQRMETLKENEPGTTSDGPTSYKISRKTLYVFKYTAKATLKNIGSRTIKAVSWDYVFTDANTQKELKRYCLQSKQQILPGDTQTLLRDVGLDPKENTRYISIGKQGVEIIKIEYTDGSVWRRQEKQ
jgi:hypothetical protein